MFVFVGRPVEAVQLIIEEPHEFHGQDVRVALLQLLLQVCHIELSLGVVLVLCDLEVVLAVVGHVPQLLVRSCKEERQVTFYTLRM